MAIERTTPGPVFAGSGSGIAVPFIQYWVVISVFPNTKISAGLGSSGEEEGLCFLQAADKRMKKNKTAYKAEADRQGIKRN
ncbi:hypothetical protein GCM10011511_20420 [Puia dinghuensis]|uniref:Uncharacterized protein n=1 Tax=Puia dinghuensis TaxID=1792502 RepID=A0A8J2UCJ5_9BACT|nr:hypothetical protein GCM10011511_20420 [Puia dinghuensis]